MGRHAAAMAEGGMKLVKFLIFFFNFIFFLAGLGLIILGALVKTELKPYFDFYAGSVTELAVLFIVLGCVIFIIGFCGCWGAFKENYCMLMTFTILLGLIFMCELACGIAAYVLRNKVGYEIEMKMLNTMDSYVDYNNHTSQLWDMVQNKFACCGTDDYSDWERTGWFGSDNMGKWSLPDSCCKDEYVGCGESQALAMFNKEGCSGKIIQMVEDEIWIVGGVGLGLAAIQIFGILLSFCLARSIKKDYAVL